MFKHDRKEERKQEGDLSKNRSEAAPDAGNAYKEDDHSATDAPKDHGEVPRKNDDSQDDKKDPDKAS